MEYIAALIVVVIFFKSIPKRKATLRSDTPTLKGGNDE